ncbi:MAG: hypothetical protein ACRD5G_15290 [Candidatus Acidiferrales bacterium]
MKTFLKHLIEPLNSIRERPYQFIVWWMVANIVGLAGFLLPILLTWSRNKDTYAVFVSLIGAGSLASFSVVLLAEGIAGALVATGTGTNLIAAGLRGLVSVLALLVVLVQMMFLVAHAVITDGFPPSPLFQVLVTMLGILCATYLYCFRFASWEKGVESVRKEDDQSVQQLAKSAQETTTDDKGVKL